MLIVVMGALYSFSVALWGVAISPTLLGTLGPSVGWAIFVGVIVLSSTVSGLLSGEWKGATANAKRLLGVSVAILIISMVLVCYGNYLH
jgi:L-rhamnose-H+ transport protein